MKIFNKPTVEMVLFNDSDIVTSSDPTCSKGKDNLGNVCGGDMTVTCENAAAQAVQS